MKWKTNGRKIKMDYSREMNRYYSITAIIEMNDIRINNCGPFQNEKWFRLKQLSNNIPTRLSRVQPHLAIDFEMGAKIFFYRRIFGRFFVLNRSVLDKHFGPRRIKTNAQKWRHCFYIRSWCRKASTQCLLHDENLSQYFVIQDFEKIT